MTMEPDDPKNEDDAAFAHNGHAEPLEEASEQPEVSGEVSDVSERPESASVETPAADREPEPVAEEPEAPVEEIAEQPAAEPVAEEPELEDAVAEEPEQEAVVAEEPAVEVVLPEIVEPAARVVEPEASPELVAEVEAAFEGTDVVVDVAAEGAEQADADLDWVPGEWYVVHTYAGYENKVKADLESRVASMNMEESIYEVVIPMEEVTEIKSGKKVQVPRKVFPGYLLVRMDLNDDSWYVVRNTPGVTGFVGSGNKPIPLSDREVDKILRRKGEPERPKPVAEWQVNDPVRVTTGPFANFQGSISEVDGERQKVKVLVNIFGRETPVELSFDQIAKV